MRSLVLGHPRVPRMWMDRFRMERMGGRTAAVLGKEQRQDPQGGERMGNIKIADTENLIRSAPYIPLTFTELGFPSCLKCEFYEECNIKHSCPIFQWLFKTAQKIKTVLKHAQAWEELVADSSYMGE